MGQSSSAHNLASLLARSAHVWPLQPAIAIGDKPLHDYATLATRVSRIASALHSQGHERGTRVMLIARNVPAYIEAMLACWWAGCVAVPVNAKLHPREALYVLDDSGSRLVFADAAWEEALVAHGTVDRTRVVRFDDAEYQRMLAAKPIVEPIAVRRDDAAWLFYTSGTTGRPKGVVITHANLFAMTLAFLADVEPVACGDAIVHAAPLSHGSGLYVVPNIARGAVNVIPESGGFDAQEIAALVNAWSNTMFFAAPTMLKRLVESRFGSSIDLSHLKCIVLGGGPLYISDAKKAYAAFGPRLAQIYGQGESPMTITAMNRAVFADVIERGDDARIGSVGVAQLGIEIIIVALDGTRLPIGEAGEVLVRGPTVMREYWGNPKASAEALRDGFLHTGDIGVSDEDGFLTLKDRLKDLIISGGANIYPREIEEVLLAHADVAEVAVIGRAHAEWGEEVVACVVTRRTHDAQQRDDLERELDAYCLRSIARFKRPRVYVFVDELPKNNAGKVQKTLLRDRFGTMPT